MTTIYKVTNQINQKAYIGLTDRPLSERRKQHFTEANTRPKTHFHNALLKYRENDWIWKVIDNSSTREKAGDLEKQYIEEFDTYKNGYNSTTGGDRAYTFSKESRQKMSAAKKGIKWGPMNANHKLAISNGLIGRICKPFTKTHRENLSTALTDRTISDTHLEKLKNNADARKGIAQALVTCPHCNKNGGYAVMKRWHFNKCKETTG